MKSTPNRRSPRLLSPGGAPAQPDATHEVPYGANQSAKLLHTTGRTDDQAKTKMEQHAPGMEKRPPRKFARTEQTSRRHAATGLGSWLEHQKDTRFQEVQVGSRDQTLYVSTNSDASNQFLADRFKTPEDLIAKAQQLFSNDTARQRRHKLKLASRGGATLGGFKKLVIPVRKRGRDGLHAERRIEEEGVTNAIGIKRPCAHCYAVLPDVSPGPGPEWRSEAASQGVPQASRRVTHVTRTREDTLTFDYGSESDSDADEPPRKKSRR